MKRLIATILVLVPLLLPAQTLRLKGFGEALLAHRDKGAPADVKDQEGNSCAVIRISTPEEGWTFDAGLAGVMEVVRCDGAVLLYIPSYARTLSVSHPFNGMIRDWPFPEPLRPGRTYKVTLETVKPERNPLFVKPTLPAWQERRRREPHPAGDFSTHFIDAWLGCSLGEYAGEVFGGMRYTYLGKTVGPYISIGFSEDEYMTVYGGAALRLSRWDAELDVHLYGGAGIICGEIPAVEAGIRFGWHTGETSVSLFDFGFGCQVWKGAVVPCVEVGLCIWGIPVACALGLVCGAI